MQDIQALFNQIQELKKEQKEIRHEYQDALANANEYGETLEQAKVLREKKKQIEASTQGRMGTRYQRFEEIKEKIEELNQLMTDVAMSNLMEGKTISLKDQYENEYEPVYKISFKKRA